MVAVLAAATDKPNTSPSTNPRRQDMPVMRATVRETEGGGGVMVVEWSGEADASTVYMGTDEMLTLTPEERSIRNSILTILGPHTVKYGEFKAPAPVPEPSRSEKIVAYQSKPPKKWPVYAFAAICVAAFVYGFFDIQIIVN
eukprot:GHVR01190317.1.p2 GENE.GHVR01190317.1~~GHVR01190317.1.p2  ORF type:complete len:142 (+),score=23.39 GHVR01190317.1:629-1054(+)